MAHKNDNILKIKELTQHRQSGGSCTRSLPVDQSEYCTMWFRSGFGNTVIPTQPFQQTDAVCCLFRPECTVCAASTCMSVACVNCIIYLSLIKVLLCNTLMVDLPSPHAAAGLFDNLKSTSSLTHSLSHSLSLSYTHENIHQLPCCCGLANICKYNVSKSIFYKTFPSQHGNKNQMRANQTSELCVL